MQKNRTFKNDMNSIDRRSLQSATQDHYTDGLGTQMVEFVMYNLSILILHNIYSQKAVRENHLNI